MSKLYLDASTLQAQLLFVQSNSSSSYFCHDGKNASEFYLDTLQKLDISSYDTQLQELYVGLGPGSFTGIRIALSFSLALAIRFSPKLFVFSSLSLLLPSEEQGQFIAVRDARSGGVYIQEKHNGKLEEPQRWEDGKLSQEWERVGQKAHWFVESPQLFYDRLNRLSLQRPHKLTETCANFDLADLSCLDLKEIDYDSSNFASLSGIEPYYLQAQGHYKTK